MTDSGERHRSPHRKLARLVVVADIAEHGAAPLVPGIEHAAQTASAIAETVQPLGIAVRGGLHTGEIELKPDDIGAIAVHIAARVAAMAEPGETLVSSTVRDLVAGSGLHFDDRGVHALRGLPEEVRLFAVTSAA
jgi:class 3 adenylate cyclase